MDQDSVKYNGCPEVKDPFELYRKAELYALEGLKERCLHFLRYNCSPGNVCNRLFTNICRQYPTLENIYIQYLAQNFEVIKEKKEWIDFCKRAKESPETADAKLLTKIMTSIANK